MLLLAILALALLPQPAGITEERVDTAEINTILQHVEGGLWQQEEVRESAEHLNNRSLCGKTKRAGENANSLPALTAPSLTRSNEKADFQPNLAPAAPQTPIRKMPPRSLSLPEARSIPVSEEPTMSILRYVKDRVKVNEATGCWEWQRALVKGYARAHTPYNIGQCVYVHRLMYAVFIGEIGTRLQVCHECDNPKCVNPSHLFLGSPKDNAQDAKSKGRIRSGAMAPNAALTSEQVLEILELKKNGLTNAAIARQLNTSANVVQKIANNKSYVRSGEPTKGGKGPAKGSDCYNTTLTEELVEKIYRDLREYCPTEVADRYGVAVSKVYKIGRGVVWKHVTGGIALPDRRGDANKRRAIDRAVLSDTKRVKLGGSK